MKVHKKDDGMKTKLQWMKEGFSIKKDAKGNEMWTNQMYRKTATYFTRKEVRKSAAALRKYKEYNRAKRERSARIRKTYQIDIPLPSDALEPYELPAYSGWPPFCHLSGKAVMIIDTETTGVDNSCNSLLQLSWQVVDIGNWEILSKQDFYFKWPSNKHRVSAKAIAVNGLTEEKLEQLGTRHLMEALYVMYQDVQQCSQFVGHHIKFDIEFIESAVYEFVKINKEAFLGELLSAIKGKFQYCTMHSTVNLCRIPGENRYGDLFYKYPKLSELAAFLKIDFSDLTLHDAADDVELTKRCYRKLMEIAE